MAGDPAIAMLLVGLNIDEISTSPFVLPKVKKVVRSISFKQAQEIARQALEFQTGTEVREFITSQLRNISKELVEE